ncbi:aldose epimerase family protein [Sphingobium sp. CR28]|uniref:aldose epimerase family protein n=1 Tax=Sphingobium sp. CR28 TaxID=3400272 RepID=UPI003FF09FB8
MRNWFVAGAVIALSVSAMANAAETKRAPFGATADGRPVEAVTLTNAKGMSATIINYGAILQSVVVPDRGGKPGEVALGYDDMTGYIKAPNYFGATVGRYANRIRQGKFSIDGKEYSLAINNPPNALHGGLTGFDKRLWTVGKVTNGPVASVVLSYVSADGEEGYPGKLSVTATYSLNENNELSVEYKATTDKPTIVNITNHSFFNLGGEGAPHTIYDHVMTIPAETITPVDATLIPTGELRPVADTPFDFRAPRVIGAHIRDAKDQQIAFGLGYDHNFVIARDVSKAPRLNVRLADPKTGRVMEVLSNQPGVQVYTGNFLEGKAVGRSGHAYRQGDGIAMEPQVFPDTPNQPAFGSARLDPGQTYRNIIVYRFSTTNETAPAN